MTVVEKSVLIGYTAAQMFELVDRVEDYPQFLPWCSRTELHERVEERTVATVYVGYKGLKSSFSTENVKQAPERMDMHLRDGPFSQLSGTWRFTPLGEVGCKVELHLHYEFSSRLLEQALGGVFGYISTTMVESFVKRAQQVYG